MTDTVIVAIIGVFGTLLGSCIGFLGNRLLEKTKAKNDSRVYISKSQYDHELDVYRTITKNTYILIVDLTTIYSDDHFKEQNKKKTKDEEVKTYTQLVNKIADFQDTLLENAPFIPEHIFKKYEELYSLTKEQFWVYMEDVKKYLSEGEKPDITEESRNRVERINDLYKTTNNELREYLSKLSCI